MSKSYLSNASRLDSNCVAIFEKEEGGYFVPFEFESLSELPRKPKGNRSQCSQGESTGDSLGVCLVVRQARDKVPHDSL